MEIYFCILYPISSLWYEYKYGGGTTSPNTIKLIIHDFVSNILEFNF